MKQKHKNAEYIIAFANGEEVEWKEAGLDGAYDGWLPVYGISTFAQTGIIFRMKPKTVTTKGYKRYAWQNSEGAWIVDTIMEDCVYIMSNGEVEIDKEWQYHVIEEKV